MTDENLNLDLKIQGKEDASQVAKDFAASEKSVAGLVKNINQLQGQLKKLTKDAQDFQTAMAGTTGGRSLGQSAKLIAGGQIQSVITNAQSAGRRSDFKASDTQVLATDVNTVFSGIRAAIAAAKNQTVIELAKTRQSITGNESLGDLKNKELAQSARVAAGQLQASRISGATVSPGEVNALTQIRAKIAEIESLQRKEIENAKLLAKQDADRVKQLDKQAAAQAKAANAPQAQADARASKLNTLFGDDGGATLFKVQAGLLVNYAIMGQIFKLFQFGTQYVVQYDKALVELQAVTASTNGSMADLSKTFVAISQQTKFSAVEIAQAAVTLGQAGLSAKQIEQSIGSIALLATASGSTLATSTDVVTSALTVFNLTASETGHVADVMTSALNLSKLTMDKLALGIQYAGNTAAEAGSTLEELVSVLGGVANAGIKSGSSIGTGVAQLFVELQNPTKKFLEQLKAVGLTIADVDVKAKGITGVLDTLAQAGFGASNAFAAFDLRAARAYLAASRNVDTVKDLYAQTQLSTAASAANQKQMESLSNSFAKLSNTVGATILQIGEPMKEAFIGITNALAVVVSGLNSVGFILPTVGTLLLSVFGAGVATKIATLLFNLTGLTGGLKFLPNVLLAASASMETFAAAEGVAAGGATLLSRALLFLAANPIVAVGVAIAAVIGGIALFNSATDSSREALDKLQTSIDENNGKYQETETRIESVNGEIGRLTDRYVELNANSNDLQNEVIGLQTKFGGFTDKLRVDTIKTVEDLIGVLKELRGEMALAAREQLQLVKVSENNKLLQQGKSIKNDFGSSFLNKYILGGSTQSKTTRAGVANVIGDYANSDPSTSSLDKLQTNETVLVRQREALISDQLRLSNMKTKAIKEENTVVAGLIQAEIDKNDVLKTNVEQLIVQGKTFTKIKRAELDDTIKGTKAVTDLDNDRQKAEQDLKEAEGTLRGATSKAAKAESIRKQKAARAALKAIDEKSKSDEFASAVASESGVDKTYVKNQIRNNLTAQINESIAESSNNIKNSTDSVAKGQKEYLNKVSEHQKLSIEELKRQIDQATQEAQNQINIIDAQLAQINDKTRGGLRGAYSDAEASALEDKKNDIETQRIKDRAQAASNADPKDGAKLSASIKTLKDYNSAQDEQIKYTNELIALKAQYAARIGEETIAHMSLGDQIKYVLEQYREQLGIQDSLRLNIKRNITDTLDSAKNSLGDYFYAWVTGTQTAGNAFKAFAVSVLQDMAKMAAKQAASGLLSGLLGGASGLLGGVFGGQGSAARLIQTGSSSFVGPLQPMSGGGLVRAAQGYGVPNRDSVPILGMPGEVMMNKSAVDMIGRDKLLALNAKGNSKVSQSTSGMPQAPQQQAPAITNVYVVSPDQKPTLTKNDILVTISDDLARRGSTAKLVKQIVAGG